MLLPFPALKPMSHWSVAERDYAAQWKPAGPVISKTAIKEVNDHNNKTIETNNILI